MDKIEQAREVLAQLRNADKHMGEADLINKLFELTNRGADAIESLIAELEKVTREAHENKDKARWANAELERIKSQEPVAWMTQSGNPVLYKSAEQAVLYGWNPLFLAAGAQPYSDSTAELSVGDSSFESWYASYVKEGTKGLKHHCRDAYAAGMGDPLVVAAGSQPAPEQEVHDALCPALTGGKCDCTESPVTVDKAWSQFCGGIGRGPDAPYPGMIEAFETHYGQSFTDKDWRNETGIWAAAWSAASAKFGAQPVPSSKYPCKLTDAELADPEYMRSYIEAMNQDYADLLYAQLVQQEPVAWEHCFVDPSKKILSYTKTCAGFPPRDDAYQINPLYAQPVQAQERKEQS